MAEFAIPDGGGEHQTAGDLLAPDGETAPYASAASVGFSERSAVMASEVVGERLVKSADRVRDLAEVFTPAETVKAMLDLLPTEMWAIHPSPTFLEPACGDGNFLVAILQRKLDQVAELHRLKGLPAGGSDDAVLFHALEALASIYAVDISAENVVGGVPGHEVGARTRLLDVLVAWTSEVLGKRLTDKSPAHKAASWVVEHNVIVGNMLPRDARGRDTGRDRIPLIEYSFDAAALAVMLRRTTIGDVFAAEAARVATEMSLFGPEEPEPHWRGKALRLAEAERVTAPKLRGQARNGGGGRR
jgi:hypothetical protein